MMAENVEFQEDITTTDDETLTTTAVDVTKQELSKPSEDDDVELTCNINKTRKRLVIDDSDSDEGPGNDDKNRSIENEVNIRSNTGDVQLPEDSDTTNQGVTIRKSRLKIVDSDSEDSNPAITEHNKSSTNIIVENVQSEIFTTNSRGELVLQNSENTHSKSKWSGICDSESSEDENVEDIVSMENEKMEIDEDENIAPIVYKKKSLKNGMEKETKKMTPREAVKLRRETLSESQRMLRETNVSLPYHKPKSFTLKEFLSRRPKLASAVPVLASIPPSVAIKLCAEKLDVISKKLEEREKEVMNFYKSESENEDSDENYVPEDAKVEDASHTIETNADVNALNLNIAAVDGAPLEKEAKDVLAEKNDDGNAVTEEINESTAIVEKVSDTVCQDMNNIEELSIVSDSIAVDEGDKAADSVPEVETIETEKILVHNTNGVVDNDPQDELLGNVKVSSFIDDAKQLEDVKNGEINVSRQNSEAFDFTLDDSSEPHLDIVDVEMEKNINNDENQFENVENEVKRRVVNGVEEERVFDGGVLKNDEDRTQETKIISNLEILKEKLANIQPRLSGGPNDVIDLDEGITKPNEISKLMERFVKHTMKNPKHKHTKVQLNVVSVDGGQIHKETLALQVDDEKEDKTVDEKPGAKLAKLRVDLQQQMAQRRSQLWKQKLEEQKTTSDEEKDVYDGDKSVCGDEEDAILDDEDEEEILDISDEELIDEDDEMVEKETKGTKSAFVYDEAEESEREEEEDGLEEDVCEKGDEEDEDDHEDNEEEEEKMEHRKNGETIQSDGRIEETPGKRKLRRIVKGFEDDSDDELDKSFDNKENIVGTPEDEEITSHQPQKSIIASRSLSDIEFLTPVSYITGIQNLNNSASKISPFRVPNVPSPLKDNNWHSDLQKKLFQNSEISNTQAQAISELCSGAQFPSDSQDMLESSQPCIQKSPNSKETSFEVPCSAPPTTQDVLGICSGEFTGTSQVLECSEDTLESDANKTSSMVVVKHTINPREEVKSLDEDEGMIISQLLDEEGMMNFKKKFESPIMTETQRRIVEKFEEHIAAGGGVIDSDEDEDLEVKRKRKQKKLNFSDDDESSDEKEDVEEEINLHDDVDDIDEDDVIEVDNIGYDSEENEIELVDEDVKKQKLKPSDFLENEAELSESEWGSEDEDEKDLDKLEFELGDMEKFDEKKIRSDLEKIHMRRMLDDDNREVKLLQELLLEDGELHGTGRERQFRWKNIDTVDDNGDNKKTDDDDDVYLDDNDEESEEQWRKRRHEREMFLKEKIAKSQALEQENVLIDSQLLKIGHEVMKTSQKMGGCSSTSQENQNEKVTADTSPQKLKSSFTMTNKRGSFLSRGEEVLQRLSIYNKVTDTVTAIGATAKNSRNFLFQSVSVALESSKDKKRKADVGTPKNIKKLRLSDNFSPADAVKKKNSNNNTSAKSKLLWNLTD